MSIRGLMKRIVTLEKIVLELIGAPEDEKSVKLKLIELIKKNEELQKQIETINFRLKRFNKF